MEKNIGPKSVAGKWSVGLNALFLIEIVATIVIFRGIMGSSFDNHWWDWTVATAGPVSIIALILGIVAWRKNRDNSLLVRLSVILGIVVTLFILLHSLFISD